MQKLNVIHHLKEMMQSTTLQNVSHVVVFCMLHEKLVHAKMVSNVTHSCTSAAVRIEWNKIASFTSP